MNVPYKLSFIDFGYYQRDKESNDRKFWSYTFNTQLWRVPMLNGMPISYIAKIELKKPLVEEFLLYPIFWLISIESILCMELGTNIWPISIKLGFEIMFHLTHFYKKSHFEAHYIKCINKDFCKTYIHVYYVHCKHNSRKGLKSNLLNTNWMEMPNFLEIVKIY
jgi:hypothetical protein